MVIGDACFTLSLQMANIIGLRLPLFSIDCILCDMLQGGDMKVRWSGCVHDDMMLACLRNHA